MRIEILDYQPNPSGSKDMMAQRGSTPLLGVPGGCSHFFHYVYPIRASGPFFFTLTYYIERRSMVFEMDLIIIVIIGLVILCLDKTKTHEEPKQVTYERIGLISEYEDSYPIISDEENAWWNRKYNKLKDEISPNISELQALQITSKQTTHSCHAELGKLSI